MSQIRHEVVAPTLSQDQRGGDTIDRHRHDEHQLIYVSAGTLAICTDRGSWVASRDRAVWIPAGVWHEHRFYGPSSLHTIGFSMDDAPLLDISPTVLAVTNLARELIVAVADSKLPGPESRRIRMVLRDQLRRGEVQPLSLPHPNDPRLAAACRAVENDLTQPRTISWLAHHTYTSERTLARLFRTEFGLTYPQWRTTVRIFQAMVCLGAGATVTETAHQCGWATSSAFIDTFTRTMGKTPGNYRCHV
jgi:AraC-like DNA-binding protein